MDSKNSQTTPPTTSTSSIRQLLGTAGAQTAHHATFSKASTHPLSGPLLLRKQPIWAVGDTPHLMPVEQGFPWHPVAMGLAGPAIPCIVAASHAHALPSAPFWFPVHTVLSAAAAGALAGGVSAFAEEPIRGRPAVRGKRTYAGQRMEEQGT